MAKKKKILRTDKKSKLPPLLVGPSGRSRAQTVRHLIDDLDKGRIGIPVFQRAIKWTKAQCYAYVWSSYKYGFCPGVVVTFELITDPGNVYLEDARQRTHALKWALAEPDEFGMTAAQALELANAEISIHHYVHENLEAAIDHFVEINGRGTVLSAAELFSGYLVQRPIGKKLRDDVLAAVGKIDTLIGGVSVAKKMDPEAQRNAIALFELYACEKLADLPTTKSGLPHFFTKAEMRSHKNLLATKAKQTEYRTALKLEKLTPKELEKRVANFGKYMDSLANEIKSQLAKLDPVLADRAWDTVALRGLLAVGLFVKKNKPNGSQLSDFNNFVSWYLKAFAGGTHWQARLVDTRTGLPPEKLLPDLRMYAKNMSFVTQAPIWGGPDLLAEAARRKSVRVKSVKIATKPKAGAAISHRISVCNGGDESADNITSMNSLRNQSQGAANMPENLGDA